MKQKKRGQITLFIILGLVIVFAFFFLIYIRDVSLTFQPSKVIPEDVVPIENMIENCLETTATPLIEHMMFHSGYTDLIQFREYYPDLRVPYELPKNRPEMEDSLKKKINIKDCVDFTQFQQFNIIEKNDPKLTVQINDEDVTLSLRYALEIVNKQNNKVTKLLDFKKIIQTKLGKLSDLARDIMNKENFGVNVEYKSVTEPGTTTKKIHFLEELTLDILRFNYPTFPLIEGMDFTKERKQWSINNDLKPTLKDRLWINLDCIQYLGTASDVLPDSCGAELYSDYYKKFKIPVTTDQKYRNTKVITSNTFTPSWDFMQFSVSPSSGDIVKPIDFVSLPLAGDIVKLYHHRYNIIYPVLFTLIEEEDEFNFATKVKIENNKANRKEEVFFTSFSFALDDFCEDKEGGNTYTIDVFEEGTFKPLDDVSLKFKCVQFECDIGKIDGRLTETFPFCYNGILTAQKENYLDAKKIILEDNLISIEMTPLIKLDYEFAIEDPLRIDSLEEGESVLVMLSNEDKNYEEQIYYPNELAEEQKIELLLGTYTYDITIYLTKDETLIGGYKNQVELTTNNYDKKIIFSIIADSSLEEPDEIADFWLTIEEDSKDEIYDPEIIWY